jgi:hypothetical protein
MRQKEVSMLGNVTRVLQRIHIHPAYFAVPVIFSVGAAALEGASMGLLIPMLNGLLTMDFSFMKELPVLGEMLQYLPESILRRDRSLFAVLIGIFAISSATSPARSPVLPLAQQ